MKGNAAPSHFPAGVTEPATKATPQLREEKPRRLQWLADLLWLLRLVVKAAPGPSAVWLASAVLLALLTPLNLWIVRHLVDAFAASLRGAPVNAMLPWVAALGGVILAMRLLGSAITWLQMRFREESGRHLANLVLEKGSQLPLEEFEHPGYYNELHRAMAGAEKRGQAILEQALSVVRSLPVLAAYFAFLMAVSPTFLAVVLLAILLPIGVSVTSGRNIWQVFRKQTLTSRLADYFFSILTSRDHAKEVRLYSLSEYLLGRWSSHYWESRNEQRWARGLAGIRLTAAFAITITVIYLGLLWVLSGTSVAISAGLVTILFETVSGLSNTSLGLMISSRWLAEQSGYASDLRAFLNLPSAEERQRLADPIRPSVAFPRPVQRGIVFENVTFTYPGSKRPTLEGLNLTLRPGEKVALVGENGAGKTTLVRLLLGLFQPDSGRITVDGIDYRKIHPESLFQSVSVVMQHFVRYQLTLGENIALEPAEEEQVRAEVAAAAQRAGAHTLADSLPQGYGTLLGPDVGGTDLSGGQWQSVAMARGFFKRAEILVLDEPTAALDPLAELKIFERFRDLADGRISLMISHRLGVARLADRVLVLRDGRLVEEGPHDLLIRAGGEYSALFNAQARWYQ